MTNTDRIITEQEVKTAMTTIRKKFITIDTRWNACGTEDYMGMYRFLTGRNSHTMSEAFEVLKDEITIIKIYGKGEIEKARKLSIAA